MTPEERMVRETRPNPLVAVTHQWDGPRPNNVTFRVSVGKSLSDFAKKNDDA